MKQLGFDFYEKEENNFIIQFPQPTEEKLIKQMAVAILKVTNQGGKKSDDKLTNK